jgi:hypothetical protein
MDNDYRSTSLTLSLPVLGPAIVVPVLLALLRQYWFSAGTFAVILAVWITYSRMVLRNERDQDEAISGREQAILTYAHTVTAFGQDPAPVIAAMRAAAHPATGEDSYFVREDRPAHRPHLPRRGRW